MLNREREKKKYEKMFNKIVSLLIKDTKRLYFMLSLSTIDLKYIHNIKLVDYRKVCSSDESVI